MSYIKFRNWEDGIQKVTAWGREKGIDNPQTQALKWVEEQGETIGELNHERFGDEYEDGLGDSLVCEIILADITGKDLLLCLEKAYNEIKDRKGSTHNGNFLKD